MVSSSKIFSFQAMETEGEGLARMVKLTWMGFPFWVTKGTLVRSSIIGATEWGGQKYTLKYITNFILGFTHCLSPQTMVCKPLRAWFLKFTPRSTANRLEYKERSSHKPKVYLYYLRGGGLFLTLINDIVEILTLSSKNYTSSYHANDTVYCTLLRIFSGCFTEHQLYNFSNYL